MRDGMVEGLPSKAIYQYLLGEPGNEHDDYYSRLGPLPTLCSGHE
jgi:hypothetical protein